MRVTFLTGASSGIGRSLAKRLAAPGEALVLVARRRQLLESLAEELEHVGGRTRIVVCDVTDRAQVMAAVAETRVTFGPIDRLIANAGGGESMAVELFSAAHIERLYALNVGGVANCIEAVLPDMLQRGAGHIVAVSSLAAYRGLPGAAAYSAAKAGLSNMVESIRIDLKPRGIDVTLICPGFICTRPSAKKKRKPLQVEVEKATRLMALAILTRKRYYAFPTLLVFAVAAGRIFPAWLYDWLLAGRGPKQKPKLQLGEP